MSQPNIKAEILLPAMEQAIDPIVIIDEHNDVVFFNPAAERMWGLSRDKVVGRNVSCLVPVEVRNDHDGFIDHNRRTGINKIVGTSREVEFTRADGQYVCGELSISKVRLPGTDKIYYIAVMKDATEESQRRKILILQNDVLQALASDLLIQDVADLLCRRVDSFVPNSVACLILVDADSRLQILSAPGLPKRYFNAIDGLKLAPADLERLKRDPAYSNQLLWRNYQSIAMSLGLEHCRSAPIRTHDNQVSGLFALYSRDPHAPQEWPERIVEACIPFCALAVEQNMTRQHISQLSNFDSLTGLLNRASLHKVIDALIMREGDNHFYLFMLDIDRFRDINDALGHVYADEFLVEIGQRIRELVQDDYIISRSGGDEYIVIVPDCTHAKAVKFAELLINTIAKPMQVGENTLSISCSVGISCFPDNGPDSESLLSNADAAMRQAKADGRRVYRFAGQGKNQVAQDRLVLGSALRDSLAKGMLNLHYQPQVEAASGGLYGVEALSRWHHPHLGNISPSRFIAVAEETGQIEAIGRWSLQEACRQMRAWDDDGVHVPTVAVNLSAVHFRNRALPQYISGLLKQYKLTPERLTVEITELMKTKERLSEMAETDTLTALLNRGGFNTALTAALGLSSKEPPQSRALVMFDLDGFKQINDIHGHHAGDIVLRVVASRLVELTDPDDPISRLGGDEFAIVLNKTLRSMPLEKYMDRLQAALERPIDIETVTVSIAGSIGAVFLDARESVEDMQKNADMALYAAKRAGGKQAQMFTDALRQRAKVRSQILIEARSGVKDGQFEVYYQPILNCHTSQLDQIEALLRWHHPERGLLAAEDFADVFTDSTLTQAMGPSMIASFQRDIALWERTGQPPRQLAINMSRMDLGRTEYRVELERSLREFGLSPSDFVLEVTEQMLQGRRAGRSMRNIRELSEAGFQIAMDNFGKGETTLRHLHDLPFNQLKIDQSLVAGIVDNPGECEVLASLVSLGQVYGLEVTVEGVETRAQFDLVLAMKPDRVQGFFISPALSSSALTKLPPRFEIAA
ncbi:EAL domain-containing protein [Novacetimonas pomaceti]|uniref:EAL domain-containing protein n=1 Tax=Novacetimonas pomaceti TaxID=2021998 RepID=UPI0038D12521